MYALSLMTNKRYYKFGQGQWCTKRPKNAKSDQQTDQPTNREQAIGSCVRD